MRVVHIITRLIVGGAQENTISTVLGLRQKPDIDVYLISGPTSGPEGSLVGRVAGIPGLYYETPHLIRPVHPIKDVLALRDLVWLLKKLKPDIVHTHSGKAGVIGRIAAKLARTPIIIHTIHGPSFGNFQGRVANMVFLAAERLAGKYTTHFIAVSQAMINQYLKAGIGRQNQYSKIYSGFNLEPYLTARNDPQLRARYGILPDEIVIGKIARLFKLKGHDDLFAVAPAITKQFPKVKFMLVGGGEWEERFKKLAESSGLKDKFIFTGLVPPEEIPSLVGIMDIVVHLSRREGLPRSIAQGLAAGKPVVAYDCDGAREACIDRVTGYLIPAGDTERLATALTYLISSPTLRESLGKSGREIAVRKFSEEEMVNRIYNLYLRLCDRLMEAK
jgi:glycosyltransferase involved in cell wall biosynthesis